MEEWVDGWRRGAATEQPKWRRTGVATSSMLYEIERRVTERGNTSSSKSVAEKWLCDFVFNVNSNEGEGSETLEETRHVLAKHKACGKRPVLDEMIREPPQQEGVNDMEAAAADREKTDVNLHDAYTLLVDRWCAEDRANNGGVPRLCIRRIKQLHFVLFHNRDFWQEAGDYRSKPVYIGLPDGSFLDMEPHLTISGAMQRLVGMTNATLEDIFYEQSSSCRVTKLVYLACSFFVAYQRIHPFIDGNGRTGRLLLAYLLSSVTPCGPNTFYLDVANPSRVEDDATASRTVVISDRWVYLSCFQQKAGDVEQPWHLIALVVEGIYVAWKMTEVV